VDIRDVELPTNFAAPRTLAVPLRGRNVGETVLFPIALLVMTLSPVLIPALITGLHFVVNRWRNFRETVTVYRVARVTLG
jgi:hypothetical protein